MKYNNEQLLDIAAKMAERSTFKAHKSGAVIAANGYVIGTGWSHVPARHMYTTYSMHAEIHALGRARHQKLNDTRIYVVTLTPAGRRTTSLPCLTCLSALAGAKLEWCYCYYSLGAEPEHANISMELLEANYKVYQKPEW